MLADLLCVADGRTGAGIANTTITIHYYFSTPLVGWDKRIAVGTGTAAENNSPGKEIKHNIFPARRV